MQSDYHSSTNRRITEYRDVGGGAVVWPPQRVESEGHKKWRQNYYYKLKKKLSMLNKS